MTPLPSPCEACWSITSKNGATDITDGWKPYQAATAAPHWISFRRGRVLFPYGLQLCFTSLRLRLSAVTGDFTTGPLWRLARTGLSGRRRAQSGAGAGRRGSSGLHHTPKMQSSRTIPKDWTWSPQTSTVAWAASPSDIGLTATGPSAYWSRNEGCQGCATSGATDGIHLSLGHGPRRWHSDRINDVTLLTPCFGLRAASPSFPSTVSELGLQLYKGDQIW